MNDVAPVLLHVLIVVVAAKAAAELADRVHIPTVVAEIVTGILIGPSLLGIVSSDQVLRVLGELGVILLLVDVGLGMRIGDLLRVGRSSLFVAIVGVALPFAGGFSAAIAFGHSTTVAIFLGGALTATSVGITARVFSDLRVLAKVEARTVLGAAVADDVLGLIILTIVMKAATSGDISAAQIGLVLVVALAFLLVSGVAGGRVADLLFEGVQRISRSRGTLGSLALAIALGFAVLAGAAGLAPIVGGFVAGISIAGSSHADRARRDLAPLAQLFVPIFFLQIGIDAQVQRFFHPQVLLLGVALLAIAIVGKIAASIGAYGSPGDKMLIGLGMIPRGEVGLIFAGLGLRAGIIDQQLYASLLLVVLVTTLVTPPALRRRLTSLRSRAGAPIATAQKAPPGGWLRTADGVVDLVVERPPPGRDLEIALRAALLVTDARPGPRLLDWMGSIDSGSTAWDATTKPLFFELLRTGHVRSWRFLEMAPILERALPELAAALDRRRADRSELDPSHALRWNLLERVHEVAATDEGATQAFHELKHPEWLMLAALILDVEGDEPPPVGVARRLVKRLDLGAGAEQEIALLVQSQSMLRSSATRQGATSEANVTRLAVHLHELERARALYVLSIASGDLDIVDRRRLDELHRLIEATISKSAPTQENAIERRRIDAARLAQTPEVAERARSAPRSYVAQTAVGRIAEHAILLEPVPEKDSVRVNVSGDVGDRWHLDLAAHDRKGLLAWTSQVFADEGIDVVACSVATWPDGAAIQSFDIESSVAPDGNKLAHAIEQNLGSPLVGDAVPGSEIAFDDDASPWSTLCDVTAPDRRRLLHNVSTAIAAAGATVLAAHVATIDGRVVDRFELATEDGSKLTPEIEAHIRGNVTSGASQPRKRSIKARLRDPLNRSVPIVSPKRG
ncbi:MAG: cation:proton antiporter [Actinomycetota bacterium]